MQPDVSALRLLILLSLGGCLGSKNDDGGSESGVDSDGPTPAACGGGTTTELLDAEGQPTGFVQCADGVVLRTGAVRSDPSIPQPACEGTEDYASCSTDADCTDAAYGKCVSGVSEPDAGTWCGCLYACAEDSDCSTGEVCLPAAIGPYDYPKCVPASCETGDECASEECGYSEWNDGCDWIVSTACRSEVDACRVDTDCSAPGADCSVTSPAEGEWACNTQNCDIGRPLLVQGAPRTAPPVDRSDWALGVDATDCDAQTAAALATHWRTVAAFEHASVGSFARATLQLLALGAPPELLADTQQAALDEVEHARLAYGLASTYAADPVGPGPLELGDASVEMTAEAALRHVIVEACVGETLGAAEAAEAARCCADPAVASVLARIADDEARHAALAWRTLQWLVQAHPELRGLAGELLGAVTLGPPTPGPDLPAHGVLGPERRLALHRAVLRAVVAPATAAVMSS